MELNGKHEVIFAGIGGMGALTAGQLLAQAALSNYRYVTWYPNITTARRNAPADCTVIFSPEAIASPLIYRVETVVAIEFSQVKNFGNRVRPGGLLIVETAGLKEEVNWEDIRVLKVAGVETSLRLGSTRAANLVLLGAYVGATRAVSPESVVVDLEKRFSSRKPLLELNRRAFLEGVRLGSNEQ